MALNGYTSVVCALLTLLCFVLLSGAADDADDSPDRRLVRHLGQHLWQHWHHFRSDVTTELESLGVDVMELQEEVDQLVTSADPETERISCPQCLVRNVHLHYSILLN